MKDIVWGCIGCGDVCERKSGPPLYRVAGSRLAACTRRDAAKGADFALVDDLKGGTLTVTRHGSETRETPAPLPFTHWGLIENFVAHLNGKAPLACDGVEGRKSTVILDLVEKLTPGGEPQSVRYASAGRRTRKEDGRFDP